MRVLAEAIGNNAVLLAEANKLDPRTAPIVEQIQEVPNGTAEVDYSLPTGLDNIGNTCYLNSILQYLYTLEPIRNLLTNFDELKLDLTPKSIEVRRIGSVKSKLERSEVVAAQKFVEELKNLFQELYTARKTSTRPKQRLANAALLSVPQLLASAKKQKESGQQPQATIEVKPSAPTTSPVPPQLPPRPLVSSKEVLSKDQETASRSSTQTLVNEGGDVAAGNITSTENISSISEAKPLLDTENKINQTDLDIMVPNGDVEMLDVSEGKPKTIYPNLQEEKEVEELINKALNNSDRSGTAQEDVEEVMGTIILRLQEAIKSTGESALDGKNIIQLDPIIENFYCVTVIHTFKNSRTQAKEDAVRWITAYPHPNDKTPVSMYEALDRSFDKAFIEDTQYVTESVIRRLPPILHICIQRSMANGRKNPNKVDIPLKLYLDRYMEDEGAGELSELRTRASDLKRRLSRLRLQVDESLSATTRGAEAIESTRRAEALLHEECFGKSLSEDPAESMVHDAKNRYTDPPTLDSETATLNPDDPPTPDSPESQTPAEEAARIRAEIENLWIGKNQYEYHLHAVICHSGSRLGFGHYWAFIHDFERKIWYRFNDETVSEHSWEECVEMMEHRGNPYYVAYVRDPAIVSIPARVPSDTQVEEEDENMDDVSKDPIVYGPQLFHPQPKLAETMVTIKSIEGRSFDNDKNQVDSNEVDMINPEKEDEGSLPTYEEVMTEKMDIDAPISGISSSDLFGGFPTGPN